MGQSTNGQICYGVFVGDAELPWEEYDLDAWWRKENGYQSPYNIYDDTGEYLPDVAAMPELEREEYIDKHFAHGRAWDKANPCPVELINACCSEEPVWILAVPGSEMTACRGYPEKFSPLDLTVSDTEVEKLVQFCEKIGLIPIEDTNMGWYLSSYRG